MFREAPCDAPTADEPLEECTQDTATILERAAYLPLIVPSGTRPSYSNFAYALIGFTIVVNWFNLIGRLLEPIFGSTFEEYVLANILKPLGMTSTGFNFTDTVISLMARGYDAPIYNLNWEAPSGQMFCTAADIAKFMSFLYRWFDSYSPEDGQPLDGLTLREWLNPGQWNYEGKTGYGIVQ